MAFFTSAVGTLQTLVIALGAGLGIWGAINLMEGYGNDNPGAKSQGMKQLIPFWCWQRAAFRHTTTIFLLYPNKPLLANRKSTGQARAFCRI